jgi:hypothetical protein
MADPIRLTKNIEEALRINKPEAIISGFTYDEPTENQLLFFFKPECFLYGKEQQTRAILEMVFEKFSIFHVDIAGILILGGKRIEELSIIDHHYGLINRLSREASKIVTPDESIDMKHLLGIESLENDCQIMGGHEFLNLYPGYDAESLNEFWLSRKSLKLRSGFYFQEYTIEDRKIILVNGFHPVQIVRYTHPDRRLIVLLIDSDTDWKSLKHDLAGDTYPERAGENSIRGEIFKNKQLYGIEQVDISNNCVHLSAGPFEALFEIDNFLENIKEAGFDLFKTNIGRRLKEKNFSEDEIIRSLSNPTAVIDGKTIDLDTFTEEKNTTESISLYLKYFHV